MWRSPSHVRGHRASIPSPICAARRSIRSKRVARGDLDRQPRLAVGDRVGQASVSQASAERGTRARSSTKRWPFSRSCRARRGGRARRAAHLDRERRRSRATLQRPFDGQRVRRGAHIVHAQEVRAAAVAVERGRHGGGHAVLGDVRPVSAPRKRLRETPSSSGPSRARRGSARSSARLCASVLPKPMPGSSAMRSRAIPAATATSARSARNRSTSATTSS